MSLDGSSLRPWKAAPLKGRVEISHGFPFQSQYFAAHGQYQLTTPGHFHEEGGFRAIGDKQKYYRGPFPERYLLRAGDLIVAMTEQAEGLLGSAAFIPREGRYLHNQRLGRVKVLSPEIDSAFLYWLLNSEAYRSKVRETAAGTKVKHTSPEKLLEIAVPIPPLPEQRAIAAALGDVDALLVSLDKLIVKKRDLKQAAMQQLLTGQTRLSGFAGEWDHATLGDLFDFRNGVNAEKRAYGIGVRFINVLEVITKSHLHSEDVSGRVDLPQGVIEAYQVRRGDVVFNRTSETQDEVALASVYVDTETVVFGGFVIRGRPTSNRLDETYTGYALRAQAVRQQLIAKGQGAIRANVGQSELRTVRIQLPQLAEQKAIATVLSDMDAEQVALQARRDKTHAIKQGMMQELLTGRTRLV